jgi:predicted acetyltransferase
VPAALQARAYSAEEAITFAIDADAMCPENVGVWRLEASGSGAACTRAGMADPDVAMDIGALGSLYLGGASPGTLAAAGRLTEHRAGAVALLAKLFSTDPAPFNAIGF